MCREYFYINEGKIKYIYICVYDIWVNQYNRKSSLQHAYNNMKDEKFHSYILRHKADVFNALRAFFKKEDEKVGVR